MVSVLAYIIKRLCEHLQLGTGVLVCSTRGLHHVLYPVFLHVHGVQVAIHYPHLQGRHLLYHNTGLYEGLSHSNMKTYWFL